VKRRADLRSARSPPAQRAEIGPGGRRGPPAFDLLIHLRRNDIKKQFGASPLVAALNDPARTRVGNPWRGTYHVSIKADESEGRELAEVMEKLGIASRINVWRERAQDADRYVTVYCEEALRVLLSAVGEQLTKRTRGAIEALVRARGPVPPEIVNAIRRKHDIERLSFAHIAHLMNDRRVLDGMGGRGWSERKVRAAYNGATDRRRRSTSTASNADLPVGSHG
jgi:hypothetical protein